MSVGGGGKPARNLTRHEVHRPRPPQVAMMSTPPACAALRIVVPGATLSVRRSASPGAWRIVSATAMASHSSGMLAPMEIGVETLRRMAALGGFVWTGAELEPVPPAVQRLPQMLERLEGVPIRDPQPATQYRMVLVSQPRA